MFKVGDKVEFIGKHPGFIIKYVSHTVINIVQTMCLISRDANPSRTYWTHVKNLAAYKPSNIEKGTDIMFKVGDKVKYTGNISNIDKNRCFLIHKAEGEHFLIGDERLAHFWAHKNELNLVVPPKYTVEDLIRVANEGLDAIRALADMGDVARYNGRPTLKLSDHYFMTPQDLRVVKHTTKPKFQCEPMISIFGTITYPVSLEGDALKVGCQTFPAIKAMGSLQSLIDKGGIKDGFYASKRGIQFHSNADTPDGYGITWISAERLLAALKQYYHD